MQKVTIDVDGPFEKLQPILMDLVDRGFSMSVERKAEAKWTLAALKTDAPAAVTPDRETKALDLMRRYAMISEEDYAERRLDIAGLYRGKAI